MTPLLRRNVADTTARLPSGEPSSRRCSSPSSVWVTEAYGRAILKDVQERLERDVAPGAVHVTLDRMESSTAALHESSMIPFRS